MDKMATLGDAVMRANDVTTHLTEWSAVTATITKSGCVLFLTIVAPVGL